MRRTGGFTFAESPGRRAPDARLIWHADLDPGTLRAVAEPVAAGNPDAIYASDLAGWLAVATDHRGTEHVVLSDGWRRIRIDLDSGSLLAGHAVRLRFELAGMSAVDAAILPLRRLIHLHRHRRFSAALYPLDRRMARWLLELRVHDALGDGASQRDIAAMLVGERRMRSEWRRVSDSLRSRVRRLVAGARTMAAGGWRQLLQRKL